MGAYGRGMREQPYDTPAPKRSTASGSLPLSKLSRMSQSRPAVTGGSRDWQPLLSAGSLDTGRGQESLALAHTRFISFRTRPPRKLQSANSTDRCTVAASDIVRILYKRDPVR